MAQQFDPNTGQWSDGGSESPRPVGADPNQPTDTSIPPQTSAPPPITAGQPPPSNVNADWWNSMQGALVSSPAVTAGQPQQGPNGPVTPGSTPGTTAGLTDTRTMDDATILAQIAQWAKMPGANPSLANDPNYWLGRIKQTGGLANDNAAYWQNLGMRPEGAPEDWSPSNPLGAGGGTAPTGVQIPGGLYAGLTPPQDPSGNNPAMNAAILKLLQTPQTVDAQTVAEAPEAVAERLQSQRSAERQVAASAEQAAQSGESGTGGQEGVSRQILANEGETDALFQGTLASTMRQQQIQQLEAGIQYAQQSGQFDKAQQLQAQLAQLSAGLSLDQLGLGYLQTNNAYTLGVLNGGQ